MASVVSERVSSSNRYVQGGNEAAGAGIILSWQGLELDKALLEQGLSSWQKFE